MIAKEIQVCFTTDDCYVRYTAVTMASILFNAGDNDRFHFHILSIQLSSKNKSKLKKLKKIRNCGISFYDINESELDIFKKINSIPHLVASAYIRLFIPLLLNDYDKVIYLDSDLLIQKNLASIANVDIGDYWIGGVEDINHTYWAAQLQLKDTKYINTGVLVINCKACRENSYYKKMESIVNLNFKKYRIADQDVINDAFYDNITYISNRYNVHWYHHAMYKKGLSKPSDPDDFYAACNEPVVVHFPGIWKPWSPSKEIHAYRDAYEHYLSMTAWAPIIPWKLTRKLKYFIRTVRTPNLKQTYFGGLIIKKVERKNGNIVKSFLGIKYCKKIVK